MLVSGPEVPLRTAPCGREALTTRVLPQRAHPSTGPSLLPRREERQRLPAMVRKPRPHLSHLDTVWPSGHRYPGPRKGRPIKLLAGGQRCAGVCLGTSWEASDDSVPRYSPHRKFGRHRAGPVSQSGMLPSASFTTLLSVLGPV